MHRPTIRRSRRAPSPERTATRTRAALLALVLLVVTGPGVAGAPARPSAEQHASPAIALGDPIADLAASLDYDVDRIFRHVADEIRYEPYPGLLRGARGTLAARAGNSVDKAVLLAALFDESLIRYRFARGPLDATAADTLLAALPADLDDARRIAQDPLLAGLEQVAAAGPSAPPAVDEVFGPVDESRVRSVEAAASGRLAIARTRLEDTVAMLGSALQRAGIELVSGADGSLPQAELDGHTWLQVGDGPDWIDHDPTLPGAQVGAVIARAEETPTELSDDLRHRVLFSVVVERMSGGQLTTDEVLTYSGFADELAATPVTFGHVTPSGMETLGRTLGGLLGGGWLDHRPVFQVGGRSLVADRGVAFPTGDATDPFGDPTATAGTGPVEGEATAEWLEVRVTPPGQPDQVSRRTVFDRLPADRRATGDLDPGAVEPIALVDFDGVGPLDVLPLLGVRTFAVATGPTTAASIAGEAGDPIGMFARSYHALRDTMQAAIGLDAGARTFLDGPNIVSLTIGVDGDASAHAVRVGLDIWRRDHGILPLSTSASGSAGSQVVAGVLAAVAERFAVETMAGTRAAPPATVGVGEVFEAAAAAGIETLVLHGTVPAALPFDARATAQIRSAVESGDVVVVPAAPVMLGGHERVGWWTVDPASGETTDVMDDGSGSEMAEYTVIVDTEVGRLICIGAMAMAAAEVIVAAATLLGSFGASSIYWTFAEGSGVGGTSCAAV